MSTGPAHRVQSAVVEYGFPNGHLGHLTDEEEAAFKNFKVLCAEKGYYTPAEGEDGVPSHDDPTLLRFLRARRFVGSDAFTQFKDTEDWRKANQLVELYETIDLEHYEETRQLYPQWTGRRDRRGIPVYVYEVKHLNAKTMHAYEKSAVKTKSNATTDGTISPKLIRLFALYENLVRFVLPLCSAVTDRDNPRTPITQSNNIVDISGVGLKQFWNLRTHMQDASTLATAHYPETLDRIFVIGAPGFFPTVWGWIKKWFDPITTSKIFIIPAADVKTTLEMFIDPANIPVKYGGQLEFKFGDFPNLDPAISKVTQFENGFTDFPQGPKYWVDVNRGTKGEDGREENSMKAIAVGTVDGKQRKEEVGIVTRVLEPTVPPHSVAEDRTVGSELLNVPTAQSSTNNLLGDSAPLQPLSSNAIVPPRSVASQAPRETEGSSGVKLELNGTDEVALDQTASAARPSVERFVTAQENLNTLSLDEKVPEPVPEIPAIKTNGNHNIPISTTVDPETTKSNGTSKEHIYQEKLHEGVVPKLKNLIQHK